MRSDGASGSAETRIFISYRRRDAADAVGRLHDRLQAHFGSGIVFRDVDDIPLGTDFRDHLDRALDKSAAVLVAIGPRWLSETDSSGRRRIDDPDDLVRIEVETALARAPLVIPVLLAGARMPLKQELPEPLHALLERNGLPVRPDPDFSNDVGRLISSIEPVLPGSSTSPRSLSVPPVDGAPSRLRVRWSVAAVALFVVAALVVASGVFRSDDPTDAGAATSTATSTTRSGSTTFVVTADAPLEAAVDPVGADLVTTRSFANAIEDEPVSSETTAIEIYCEGFGAGSFMALMALHYGGAVVPECGDVAYPNNIGVRTNGEAWCQGYVDGVDAAHRQLKDAMLDADVYFRIDETCRVRRWWTEAEAAT